MSLIDKINQLLANQSNGINSLDIAQGIGLGVEAEDIALVEAYLLYNPHCRRHEGKWHGAGDAKMQRVLDALAQYSAGSEKKIFRLSSALKDLPMAMQPTEAELEKALDRPDAPFRLLPNAMIKKVDHT